MAQAHELQANLYSMGAFGFIAVDVDRVKLDDLLHDRPGAIVRCFGAPNDCITVYPADNSLTGCVAGWISEEA